MFSFKSNCCVGYGLFVFRVLVSVRLLYGVVDNVFNWERMVEFERFLAARDVPWPLAGAIVSVYIQFLCGILILFGSATRIASVLIIVNFIAALFIAHRADTFLGMFQALTMLFAGFLFLMEGPGKLSIDEWWKRKHSNQVA